MKNLLAENKNVSPFLVIADRLAQNANSVKYGSVSVELQIHDGRIVTTTYAMTEKTRLVSAGGRQSA